MEAFRFHEGSLPSGYQPDFESALYNQSAYLLMQAGNGWQSFYVLNPKHHRVEAAVFFFVEDQSAFSPWRAPFGSFELSKKISPETFYRFIEYVESRLLAMNVKKIVIKNRPQLYDLASSSLTETFLFNLGYRVVNAELSAMIPLGTESLLLDSWEKRKLRQSREANLEFRRMDLTHLDEVYLFILACRKQKNYSLSMSLAELRKTMEQFSNRYVLFGVFRDNTLAAASVAVRVTHTVLYNFYSDHDKQFNHLSPVVFLLEGMYAYGLQENLMWLDLGTSALDGAPNFGLLDFKMRLRGQPTSKLTFQKDF